MPSLNLSTKSLRYAAADETVLDKAVTLLAEIREYDQDAKQDAQTGLVSLRHLQQHVKGRRNGTPVQKSLDAK
jgi:hypothetical protein